MKNLLPQEILFLTRLLKKLPGIGTKTAERFAFEFLLWEEKDLKELGNLLSHVKESVVACSACGCFKEKEKKCPFCTQREESSLCIVASPRDVYAIEKTGHYRGLYHVIEHLLSPIDGRFAAGIRLDRIEKRISENQTKEIIIALDSTLEGDTTALYLKKHLEKFPLQISRIAFGLPVGSSFEYIDGGTLLRAFSGRQTMLAE